MSDVTSGRQLRGTVELCLIADGADFRSRRMPSLALDLTGIVGDIHAGVSRGARSREPWYPRGTEIRNDRQVTIVSPDELAEVAAAMDVPAIAPEWIGANLVLAGVPRLTLLPAGTRLFFADGATLVVSGENAPCRIAGRSIGEHYPQRAGFDLLFPKLARQRRGLVATVERPGTIHAGEAFSARLPVQHVYEVDVE